MLQWLGPNLREWQREALDAYLSRDSDDFLSVATPGAGKTTFALRLAYELLASRTVDRIVVVVPTEHLKVQWANNANDCGIALDPTAKNSNGLENRSDFRGAVLTYAQVASTPALHRAGCDRYRTLVVLDEIHHAGDDKSWGDAVKVAFGEARRRLAMSGTPFRSDNNAIPFVTYGADGKSQADFSYGYGRAIRDDVCRQVDFHLYDGEMQWMGSDATTSIAALSAELERSDASGALETALAPDTGWMRQLLVTANSALADLRVEVPNAGGLVIAYTAANARAYAAMLYEITGDEPTVVLSEDGKIANDGIERFSRSTAPWLVAVRMVSEGVDVPRLAVGVYATKTKTEMFFRQAVGRFVRRRPGEDHPALIFAPAISSLRIMAAQVEREIAHELKFEQQEFDRDGSDGDTRQEALTLFERTPIAASAPTFDRAILGGEEYTPEENDRARRTLEQYDFPASSLASMRRMLRDLAATPVSTAVETMEPTSQVQVTTPAYRLRKAKMEELSRLARRIGIVSQTPHAHVQSRINEHMGVSKRPNASIQQLNAGLVFAKTWLGKIT